MTDNPKPSKIDSYFYVTDETVYGFFKDYRFLSNYHISPVSYQGLHFTCSEAAYQGAKCLDPKDMVAFTTMTPSQARATGQVVQMRKDWEQIKLKVMTDVLYSKFSISDELRTKLLETGERDLIEANHWGDRFWGVDAETGLGESWLGKILMGIRHTFSIINI